MKFQGSLLIALSLCLAAPASLLAADKKKAAAPPAPPAPTEAPAAKPLVLPDTVAVVEGSDVKKEELIKAFNNLLSARKMSPDAIPPEQRLQGYHMVLDEIIIDKLLAKRAEKTAVTDDEVKAQWERIKGNFGSEEELKKQVEAAGETIDKVKKGLHDRIAEENWINEQIKDKVNVTDADAEDFYKKNPEQFKSPEQVRASHILVKVDATAKPEQVVEKQKAAQAIADRVKKGEDFGKLAKELSEDPSAKQNSGDLDFFTKEAMVPEFSKAAFAMKKDEISDPVRSEFGFHVIKVTDRKDAETVTLEKARPQLLAYLKNQKKQAEIEKVVQDVRAKADVKINLPEPPAPPAPAPGAAPAPEPAPAPAK
ncbi:MAG: peptidylprolyl isomerase [Chthoniobacter sp.]|uniref:peptidylprolyl isomerase n=1 Tax=Chthoniobacter sp. TaxID=2510640 RepID=UPI0032ADFF33